MSSYILVLIRTVSCSAPTKIFIFSFTLIAAIFTYLQSRVCGDICNIPVKVASKIRKNVGLMFNVAGVLDTLVRVVFVKSVLVFSPV